MGVSNKTLIIIFVAIILIIALILGGKIGYDYYMDSCEVENEVILNFIEDMVKGHKSYSDIDSLEASEDVKENLREFYSGFFFSF